MQPGKHGQNVWGLGVAVEKGGDRQFDKMMETYVDCTRNILWRGVHGVNSCWWCKWGMIMWTPDFLHNGLLCLYSKVIWEHPNVTCGWYEIRD